MVDWVQSVAQKQLEKAATADMTPLRTLPEEGGALFAGSDGSQYYTTLQDCECASVQYIGIPCKHMVRLAIEKGLFPGAAVETSLDAAILKYEAGLAISMMKQQNIDTAILIYEAIRMFFKKPKLSPVLPDGVSFDFIRILQPVNKAAKKWGAALLGKMESKLSARIFALIKPQLSDTDVVQFILGLDSNT